MNILWHDLRYALRQLRKSPGFAAAAILTLALGIGATAAMFSVLDAVLLHPLPYNGVNRIVRVNTKMKAATDYDQPASWPEYLDMRRLNKSFSAFVGLDAHAGMTLTRGNQSTYLHTTKGTANFFDLFGVTPMLGRTFLPGEDQNGKNNVVVLSYEVWQQNFGGKRSVLGKTVHLDGAPYVVVGVMPAGFRYPVGVANRSTHRCIYPPIRSSLAAVIGCKPSAV